MQLYIFQCVCNVTYRHMCPSSPTMQNWCNLIQPESIVQVQFRMEQCFRVRICHDPPGLPVEQWTQNYVASGSRTRTDSYEMYKRHEWRYYNKPQNVYAYYDDVWWCSLSFFLLIHELPYRFKYLINYQSNSALFPQMFVVYRFHGGLGGFPHFSLSGCICMCATDLKHEIHYVECHRLTSPMSEM